MWSASYSLLESALSSCAALIFPEKQFEGTFMTLHMTDMWKQKPAILANQLTGVIWSIY